MKEKILETAEQLVLKKGFNATSISDICQEAGISKGGFFHCFKSKADLTQALITTFAAKTEAMMLAGIDTSISDSKKRFHHFLDHMLMFAKDPKRLDGCIVGIACQELAFCSDHFQHIIVEGFTPGLNIVTSLLTAMKEEYNLVFNTEKTAYFFLSIVQGSMLIARGTANNQHLFNNILHFKDYMNTMIDAPANDRISDN